MKVCFLTTSYPRSSPDGYARFVHEQAKSLLSLELGYEITVIAPHAKGLKREEIIEGVKVIRFSYFWPNGLQRLAYQHEGLFSTLKRDALAMLQLPFFLLKMFSCALANSRGAGVIHAQWLPTSLVALPVSVIRGTPLFVSARGADLNKTGSLLGRLIMLPVSRANAVLVVSNEFKQRILSHDPTLNVHCLYNGVDSELFSTQLDDPDSLNRSQNAFTLSGTGANVYSKSVDMDDESCSAEDALEHRLTHPKRIAYIGGLIPRKRVDTLISALATLNSETETEKAYLSIAGEGSEREALEQLVAQHGLSNKVGFLGKLDRSQVADLLSECDILVLPSESEGRPNVVLEAFSSGVAVVASDIPGTAELITKGLTGELFKVGDSRALAESLKAVLLDDSYRGTLAANALQSLQENGLTWEAHGQSLHRVYQQSSKKTICAE